MSDALTQYRVFPRLFAIFYFYGMYKVMEWYMKLGDPTTEQSGVVVAVITAAAAYFKFYVESGKD